jgi:hypothetical protein
MDQKSLENKRIKIPNVTRLFFTPTKQSYSKHVERIKSGKRWETNKKLGPINQDQSHC